MQLRYNYRLYPSPGQRVALARAFGCARVVFNDGLAAREQARAAGLPYLTDGELSRLVITLAKRTPERGWLGEVSAVVLQQALADSGMMERGWGRIQFIASDSAVVTPEEMVHYGMSKTALLAVSRGYAKAAAGTGVTVNTVMAGPTHTEGVEDFVAEMVGDDLPWDDAQRRFMAEHRPQSLLRRLIEPEKIANMVVYLSSDLASATTGGAVRVDGGYVDAILP